MDRKTAVAYSVLVATTTICASIAVVWFGPASSLVSVPGIFGRSDSVWILFATPVLLTVVGLFGAISLTSTRVFWTRLDELTPDAQQGLERYRNTERRLFIGTGVIIAFVQLLVILSTAGFAVPLEFGARTAFFVFGALFTCAGNMTPKVPFFSRWWQTDRAVYTRVSRFTGRVLTVAGILVCLLAVFAPLENVRTTVKIVLGSAVGLMIVNALLQAFIAAARKRA